MKAAVVHGFGETPRFEDFAEPEVGEGDVRVTVEAAALENFDRLVVGGGHYGSRHMFPLFPAVVGHSGVGRRDDGTRVAFGGTRPPHGAMAEVAVIPAEHAARVAPVPEGVDAAVAAALPAAAMTSLLGLRHGARLQPGQSVLINGATGVAGKLAVQVARLLGAGRVVGSGRSRAGLAALPELGASATVDLTGSDEEITAGFAAEAGDGWDVVIDYVWGHPTELLLRTLVPSTVGFPQRRVRVVQIGQAAEAAISLPAEVLRTSGVELAGIGPVDGAALGQAATDIWEWLRGGELRADVERVPLRDVAAAWDRRTDGSRIVIVP